MTDPESSFDSTFFTAACLRRSIFYAFLEEDGFSEAQFVLLLSVVDNNGDALSLNSIAERLLLSPSTISKAAAEMESRGLLIRKPSPEDGRILQLSPSAHLGEFLSTTEENLRVALALAYNPDLLEQVRPTLVKGVRLGGRSCNIWSESMMDSMPVSCNLSATSLFLRHVDSTLKSRWYLSSTDARILQYLGEMNKPLRVHEIAQALHLSVATITRTGSNLQNKGLLDRLVSTNDKKAVYFDLTEKGIIAEGEIEKCLSTLAQELYWPRFTKEELKTVLATKDILFKSLVLNQKESDRIAREALRETNRYQQEG